MKKLLSVFVLSMIAIGAWAQTPFQGTIKYDWKFMGEGVEQYEAMMPSGATLMVLKSNSRFHMEGGMVAMMFGDFLHLGKKNETYMIKDAESTAYKMKADADKAEEAKPVVVKEDEVVTIAGYECQKYRVDVTVEGITVSQYVWATEKFSLPSGGGGMMGGSSGSIEGVKGAVLKSMTNQGGMTMIMTAAEINTTAPDKASFKVPKGYKIEDFDPAMFGGMGM